MSTKRKTGSLTQQPNATELSEAEPQKVNGGIIAILIGRTSTSTQSVAPTFIPPGPST